MTMMKARNLELCQACVLWRDMLLHAGAGDRLEHLRLKKHVAG